jgi:hypothetical protein
LNLESRLFSAGDFRSSTPFLFEKLNILMSALRDNSIEASAAKRFAAEESAK